MSKIAILGFGVIGRGVYDVVEENSAALSKNAGEKIEVAKVVDIRDLSETKAAKVATKDFGEVLADPSIDIVVECMGGDTIAYEFTKKALLAGKSVVTSNKAVVCSYGAELMAIAEKMGVTYLFEASVGGGIPIIHPMKYCLWANEVESISGILNGTTNFMLTLMNEKGASFADALALAQKLGYAEQDPTADVDGFDAARKIAILSSIVIGSHVALEDVSVIEGIRNIGESDVAFAAKAGYAIKLLGRAVKTEKGFAVYVAPHFIPQNMPLSSVSDVFNAICVSCNMLGDAMFYGKGAGSLPTASAVVSDVIEAVRFKETKPVWSERKAGVTCDANGLTMSFFVRADGKGAELYGKVVDAFGKPAVLSGENDEEIGFIASDITKSELDEKLSAIGITPASVIRVL